MKRILCIMMAIVFLSGCALTTIKPAKRHPKAQPEPAKKSVVERVKEVFKPEPGRKPVVVKEKEEILPLEKEETLPQEEDIK